MNGPPRGQARPPVTSTCAPSPEGASTGSEEGPQGRTGPGALTDLARLGSIVADDLEHRGYRAAGVVRQLVRAVATLTAPAEDACPVCGGRVDQPATGRRRVYCGTPCRRRARNRRVSGG